MSTEENSDTGTGGSDGDAGDALPSSGITSDGEEAAQFSDQQRGEAGQSETSNIRQFVRELKVTDWITAIATAVIAAATIWNVWYVGKQLSEMQSSGQDTKNLVIATQHLADAGSKQADAMNALASAGQSQADSMRDLKKAGEAQARASEAMRDSIRGQTDAAKQQASATVQSLDVARNAMTLGQRARVGPIQASLNQIPVGKQALTATVSYGNFGREPAIDFTYTIFLFSYVPAKWNDGTADRELNTYARTTCANAAVPRSGDVVYPTTNPTPYVVNGHFKSGEKGISELEGGSYGAVVGCFVYATLGKPHHTAFCFYWHAHDIMDIAIGSLPNCNAGQYSD